MCTLVYFYLLFLLAEMMNLFIFAFDNEEDSIHHRHPLSAPGLWTKKGVQGNPA